MVRHTLRHVPCVQVRSLFAALNPANVHYFSLHQLLMIDLTAAQINVLSYLQQAARRVTLSCGQSCMALQSAQQYLNTED